LAFDLGGSSTEFMLLDPSQSEPLWVTSVFLGAATLTENHIGGDPPEPGSVKRAKRAAREELAPVFREVRDRLGSRAMSNLQVVGTAGTATTLAAIRLEMEEYEPYRVNGLELSLKWLQSNLERLASLDFHARARLPGLEAGRADIILGGAAIVGETLAGLESDRLTVTDAGLLEGLLLDGVERARRLPPALRSPLTFARKTS
jgi:exopolyphosphatase/guanosine-5'-triphosphate,3'-diphosphate pyrophosphatase